MVTVRLMHEWLTVFWDSRIIANGQLNYLCFGVYKHGDIMVGNISIECSIEPFALCDSAESAFLLGNARFIHRK